MNTNDPNQCKNGVEDPTLLQAHAQTTKRARPAEQRGDAKGFSANVPGSLKRARPSSAKDDVADEQGKAFLKDLIRKSAAQVLPPIIIACSHLITQSHLTVETRDAGC
jgi:hypothetical protein